MATVIKYDRNFENGLYQAISQAVNGKANALNVNVTTAPGANEDMVQDQVGAFIIKSMRTLRYVNSWTFKVNGKTFTLSNGEPSTNVVGDIDYPEL